MQTLIETIPYGRQDISQADIDTVVDVLRSDFITQGLVVPAFESAVAKYCNAQYAVAVNSATSALHIACLALGVGKGDVVWTTPITFVASTNCAPYCGAHQSTKRCETFVTRKITRATAKIALVIKNCLYLVNLDVKRDWGHVKDYIEGMFLILQQKNQRTSF